PGRVPGHLLVGMDPPAARPAGRLGVPGPVRRVPDSPRVAAPPDRTLPAALRPRRAAGAGGLVDGLVGPRRPRLGRAGAADDPPGAGLPAVRGPDLDRARRLDRRRAPDLAQPMGARGAGAVGLDLRAGAAGGPGGRNPRRLHLQRLAADERQAAAGRLLG